MKNFLFVAMFIATFTTFSQSKQKQKPFHISGILMAADSNTPLESATVFLQRVQDSTLVTYTITDQKGVFELEGKTYDETLNLVISYIGFENYKKKITITAAELKLGTISIQPDTNELDEIVVKATSPVTIKKDTLEFNVASFKTKKDANVEDLLKKLPGVEVDETGKITVNGKDVSNVFVNGKPFFGDDPTITTRNLTKELIEKVQILDTKTKSEAFTGEESESDSKTINLTISEDKNKGVFGRISAGAGTDERYEGAGMVNFFDNDQRISVLLGGNNTNSLGFSFGEIEKMFGGGGFSSVRGGRNGISSFSVGGRSFGGGQGITTSKNAGFNYADNLSKKVELSADYFYSNSNSVDKSATQRENILPDTRYFTDSNSTSTNDTYSHSANLELEVELDSTLRIDFEPSISSSRNTRNFYNEEESRDDNSQITNQSNADSFIENIGNSFRNEIDVTKRFGSRGSYLRLSVDTENNKTTSEDFLTSDTEIFGDNPETIVRNQFTDGKQDLSRFSTSIRFRLPLKGKEWSLDFNYRYWSEKQLDEKNTFDFDDTTQEFNIFNTALSTDFEYKNSRSVPGLRLSFRNKETSLYISGNYVFRTISSKDGLRPNLDLKRNFEAFEAYTRLRHRFSPKSSISLRYSLNNSPPSTRQLQPFEDVTNPINTVVGNPNLRPSNSHDVSAYYNNFDFQKKLNIYTYVGSTFTNDQVVSNTTIDDNFVRNTTYANVNGSYSVNGGGGIGITTRIDTVKTVRFGLNLNGGINRFINFNNGVKYAADNTSISPRLEVAFDWKDVMEVTPNYRISFNRSKYDIEQFENQEFLSHNVGIRTATFLPKKLEWRNDIAFNYNPNVADGFQKSAWFWNATLAYSILKDKAAITLKAYDLLNQNTNARRIATANYIQDSQSTVLQRYFMLSFSWKFNTLGSAAEEDNNRGRGHYRRRG